MAWRGRGCLLAVAVLALAAGLTGSASAASPSFSCSAAKAPIEKLICSDDGLSQADADMAAAYKKLRQTLDATGRSNLLLAQRRWLQSRFAGCQIPASGEIPSVQAPVLVACLDRLYAARAVALADVATATQSPSNSVTSPSQPVEQGTAAQGTAEKSVTAQADATVAAPASNTEPSATQSVSSVVAADHNATVRLDQTVFTATGRQETLLSIGQFGRYALTTHSGQGTALQLIDRMAGPGTVSGVPGSSDGRVDAFLDHGAYKVVLQASDKGSGEVELDVHPFVELSGAAIPTLTELKLVQGELGDFQQRSYWLDIKERRVVAFEAAGRNLADLRLWRDGNWLVDATPAASDSEPEPGKPLQVRQLVTTLEPGLYLLSAYGGPTTPWAKTAETHPFYLRMGIPSLSEGGRQVHIASPFGVDRYLVPASANYFRLELPEAEAAELSVGDYTETAPYNLGQREGITKKSVPPVAELTNSSNSTGQKLITISREAGKPYLLQQFKSVSRYYFEHSGDYWVGTLHSGYGDDNIDVTPILTQQFTGTPERIYKAEVPELNAQARWSRRFNLLATATAYFHVTEAGSYQIEAAGASSAGATQAGAGQSTTPANGGAVAEYLFEPFVKLQIDYKAPDYQPAGQPWKLEPGYYILTMRPKSDSKGILTVTVRGAAATTGTPDDASQQKLTGVTWPQVNLNDDAAYILYLNDQPGVEAGVVLRNLPVDLSDDLPVNLTRNQQLDIPVRAAAGDTVTVIGEDGQPLEFSVDHATAQAAWAVTAGNHLITLSNKSDKPAFVTVHETPAALAPETPMPAIDPSRLGAIPVFLSLPADVPSFVDIAKDEKKTFALSLQKPGLYRLESSGLLQTEAAIRTRTIIALDRQANNGTGRNFLIQQYLGEGDYQLTVNAQGQTQGHMGIGLVPTVLDEGGQLSLDLPARHSLTAGHGLRYTFTVPATGHYHVRAIGLNRDLTMRLEDADGWPIIKPGSAADLDSDFAPGTYHLVILPQPVDAKVITLLEERPTVPVLTGHGPHDLPLNQQMAFQWLEPGAGQPRSPDLWHFDLPGAAQVAIDLPRGLQGKLRALTGDGSKLPDVNGGETWTGDLPTGSYELAVSSRQPNNRLDYTIDIKTTELLAGQSRTVTVPADLPISIGSDAIVEISSFGNKDVRAWLYDTDNTLVATNDDRPNDWNFAITGRLKPGKYRLHVDPVGSDQASTMIAVFQSREQTEPALQIGSDTTLSGPVTHLLPLNLPATASKTGPGSVLVVSAAAAGNTTGLSLEQSNGAGAWQTAGEITEENPWLALPVDTSAGHLYRLRLWSADRSTAPINLQSRLITPDAAKQAQFLSDTGIALQPVPGVSPALNLSAVAVTSPGSFHFTQAPEQLRWSGESSNAFKEAVADIVFARGDRLYFAARSTVSDRPQVVTATRLTPTESGIALTLPAQSDAVTLLDASAGGGKPTLWIAQSRLGQPGLALERDLAQAQSTFFGVAVGDQSAVAIAADAKQGPLALRLWNADQRGKALALTLRRLDFTAPKRETLDWAVVDRPILAKQALAFDLPKGLKRLRLALPPQTAVLLQTAGQRNQLIWSGSDGLALTRDTAAEHLLALTAGTGESHLGIALAPLTVADALPELGGGRVAKQYTASAGVLRLGVTLSAGERQQIQQGLPLTLHVAGAVDHMSLLASDGRVQQGNEIAVSSDGVVDIAHEAGLVVAWIEGGDRLLGVAGAGQNKTSSAPIKSASIVPLSGVSQTLTFGTAQAKLLHLRTTAPVIAVIPGKSAAPDRLRVYPDGADFSIYLTTGETVLGLQSAAAGALSGVAEISMTDILPISEGLGPRQRLAPGETRLFSFTVTDERDIGVGVKGSADTAHCRLLDDQGVEIGTGVVQMPHLKAGTYLLAVDMPPDGTAIDVQPALVGVTKPDGSPPDDVKRDYLSLAGLKPKQQE